MIGKRLVGLAIVAVLLAGGSLFLSGARASALSVPTAPIHTVATIPKACQSGAFFGLRPWFQYLTVVDKGNGNCKVCFSVTDSTSNFDPDCKGDTKTDIPLVGLAIVDDLLRVAGLIAIAFIIYGAIRYITSQGSPEDTAKAQGAIVNALIGLVVSLVAVGFVSFIGARLGG